MIKKFLVKDTVDYAPNQRRISTHTHEKVVRLARANIRSTTPPNQRAIHAHTYEKVVRFARGGSPQKKIYDPRLTHEPHTF